MMQVLCKIPKLVRKVKNPHKRRRQHVDAVAKTDTPRGPRSFWKLWVKVQVSLAASRRTSKVHKHLVQVYFLLNAIRLPTHSRLLIATLLLPSAHDHVAVLKLLVRVYVLNVNHLPALWRLGAELLLSNANACLRAAHRANNAWRDGNERDPFRQPSRSSSVPDAQRNSQSHGGPTSAHLSPTQEPSNSDQRGRHNGWLRARGERDNVREQERVRERAKAHGSMHSTW